MSAVRSAVDKAIGHVVALNLEKCILDERDSEFDQSKLVQEAVELLIKSRF